MRIVLIGDLHFYDLRVWPWELAGKRFLGQMNLWFNRRFTFKLGRMAALEAQVLSLKPDLLLFSGDLTTTALAREFKLTREALGPVLKAIPAVIVPGNHDRHSFTSARLKLLERYFPDHAPSRYPHHQELSEGLHLLALDPTRPNIIGDRGSLGARQLEQARGIVRQLPTGARLIVLCHYTLGVPPGVRPEEPRHGMTDAPELKNILAEGRRPTLYLHGHVHTPFCWRLPDAANIVAVNAGAPLMHDTRWLEGQGFWEIEAPAGPGGGDWGPIHHSQDSKGDWLAEPVGVPTQPGGAVIFT